MLRRIAIAAGFLLAGVVVANAMSFTWRDYLTVHALGPIEQGDAAQFSVLPKFDTLELDSPGGLVGEALRMAANMDARGGIRTVVKPGSSCASACAMALFVSGKTRIVYMGGRVGIHSCAMPGTIPPISNVIHRPYRPGRDVVVCADSNVLSIGGHMKRRAIITLLGGAVAWPLAASAQQPKRMRQIGVLMSFAANDPEGLSRAAAFENGLRKLGWIRGHNLRVEYRWAENPEVLRTDAIELVGMAPDLILANSTPVMAALQEQRHAVPIVFTQVTDPVGEGLVLNLAHPGGHLTELHQFRVLDRDQVAGDAQASGDARHACRARLQPADRPIRP